MCPGEQTMWKVIGNSLSGVRSRGEINKSAQAADPDSMIDKGHWARVISLVSFTYWLQFIFLLSEAREPTSHASRHVQNVPLGMHKGTCLSGCLSQICGLMNAKPHDRSMQCIKEQQSTCMHRSELSHSLRVPLSQGRILCFSIK